MGTHLSILNGECTNLRSFWLPRTLKIEDWYKLRLRQDENVVDEYDSVVSNDPKTFFNLAQYMLSAMPARHNLPVKDDTEAVRIQKSKSERGLMALWQQQDIRMGKKGRRPWRWEMSDFMLITGWYAVFSMVDWAKDGTPIFYADILDPKNVFQEWDDEGLALCLVDVEKNSLAMKREIEAHIARGEEGWTLPNSLNNMSPSSMGLSVVRSSLWRVERDANGRGYVTNVVMVNNEVCKEESLVEGIEEIPILTGPAAGEAAWGGYGLGDINWQERYGESILEPNAEMYEYQNKNMTRLAQLVADYAIPTIVDENESGDALVTADDVKKGRIIHVKRGDKVYAMRIGKDIPPEIYTLQGTIEQKVQQGSVPYTLFGAVPPALDLSGFAIGLLMTAAQNVVGLYQASLTNVVREIDRIWLVGMKNSQKPVVISGRARPGDSGSVFLEDWYPEDVPDSEYVDVVVPLATPSDLLERVTIARQAKPMGDILDDITILEEVIKVEDAQLVKQRLDEQMFENTPQVQALKMVLEAKEKERQLREAGQTNLADIMKSFAEQVMNQLGAPTQGGPPAPKPGIRPENGGSEKSRGRLPEERLQEAIARSKGQGK